MAFDPTNRDKTPVRKAKVNAFQKIFTQNEADLERVKHFLSNEVPRRKKRSKIQQDDQLETVVWGLFTKLSSSNDLVVCNVCGKQLGYQPGSLKSLRNHLKQNHLELWRSSIASQAQSNNKVVETPMAEADFLRANGPDSRTETMQTKHLSFKRTFVSQDEQQPVRQRAKRSFVWEYYIDGPVREGSNTALCKLCCQQIKWRQHSTSSLGRHLKFRHPDFCYRDMSNFDEASFLANSEQVEGPTWGSPDEYLEHSISVGCYMSNNQEEGRSSLENQEPEVSENEDGPRTDVFQKSFSTLRSGARRSIFRNYFTNRFDYDGSNVAVCNTCHQEIRWRNGSTTGMESHLKRIHPHIWLEASSLLGDSHQVINSIMCNDPEVSHPMPDSTASGHVKVEQFDHDENPSAVPSTNSNSSHQRIKSILHAIPSAKVNEKYSLQDQKQLDFDMAVCELVVSTGLPFSWIDTKGFEKFVCKTCPKANIKPSAIILGERLPEIYENVKSKIKALLSKEICQEQVKMLGITSSTWTSLKRTTFMSISCQYVTPDWKIRRVLIDSRELQQESISFDSTLESILSELFNSRKSLREMKYCLVNDFLPSELFSDPINSTLSIEQLISVNGAIEAAFQHALASNTSLADAVSKSNSFIDTTSCMDFEKESGYLKTKLGKLSRASHTLNSQLTLISSILECRDEIEKLKETFQSKIPTQDQFELLASFIPVLKRIKSVLVKLCSDKNPTSPLVIPLLMILEAYLKSLQHPQPESIKQFGESFVEELNNRLPKNGKLVKQFRMACFLHPVYRGFPLEDPEGEGNVFEKAKQDIISSHPSTSKWLEEVESAKAEIAPKEKDAETSGTNSDVLPNIFLKRMKESNVMQEQTSPVEVEIQAFLGLPNKPEAVDDINILEWWQNNEDTFPKLSEVAKEVFSIPSTLVSGDVIYESVDKMLQSKDKNFDSSTFNLLTFIQNNELHFS